MKAKIRKAGLYTLKQLLNEHCAPRSVVGWGNHFAPRIGESPLVINGEEYYSLSQCEPLLTAAKAKQSGLYAPANATPCTIIYPYNRRSYRVYRLSKCLQEKQYETDDRGDDVIHAD